MEENEPTATTRTTIEQKIQSTLQDKCKLCLECSRLFLRPSFHHLLSSPQPSTPSSSQQRYSCTVCFGILSDESLLDETIDVVHQKFEPYGGISPSSSRPVDDADGSDDSDDRPENKNYLSRSAPTVVLPPLILITAQGVLSAVENALSSSLSRDDDGKDAAAELLEDYMACTNASELYTNMKENFRDLVHSRIYDDYIPPSSQHDDNIDVADVIPFSKSMHDEEAGYLNYHILLTPPSPSPPSSSSLFPPSDILHLPTQSLFRKDRKRFRGNDPTEKQGGDPRTNLEKRFVRSLISSGNESLLAAALAKNIVQNAVDDLARDSERRKQLGIWLVERVAEDETRRQLQEEGFQKQFRSGIHVAAWRNHLYVEGRYTKSRRDISQTPFYVPVDDDDDHDDNNPSKKLKTIDDGEGKQTKKKGGNHNSGGRSRMKKLGISSVEEQICPIIAAGACGGTASFNNYDDTPPAPLNSSDKNNGNGSQQRDNDAKSANSNGIGGGRGRIVYGMCKFHASGREDMNVRMVLPKINPGEKDDVNDAADDDMGGKVGGGRPFVCEIIDALRMPTIEMLKKAVYQINHLPYPVKDKDNNDSKTETVLMLEDVHDKDDSGNQWIFCEKDRVNPSTTTHCSLQKYGRNPMGVGISSLSYCISDSYRTLQSHAEDKVKFYGCLCWSEILIPNQGYLDDRLLSVERYDRDSGTTKDDNGTEKEEDDDQHRRSRGHLTINQCTPLRVLHRRSTDTRQRIIRSIRPVRINEHYFRLHLSTSAGTYVKEFVHGDCGRTEPSVSSLFGCKTDILELDCEGVAV